MDAEILAVGTELLMGQIANTNAQYISQRFNQLGINVFYHSVVGDNPARLKKSLELALSRADIVITTGGLGPTKDDLTKETIAEAFNRKMVFHEDVYERLQDFFKKLHKNMANNNNKQAYLPEDSIIVPNNKGTAPGCIIEENGKTVVMLPGPPNEMQPMFEETVFPYFKQKTNTIIESKMLRIFGIGESSLENMLEDIIDTQSNPTIAPYVKQGEVTLRVTAKCETKEKALELIDPEVEKIHSVIGDTLYSTDGKDLDEVTVNLLIKNNISIATAESCTGGLLSSTITNISGASAIFQGGYITYSNELKINELGVKRETIEKYGAVSSQTAKEMAMAAREKVGTDLGVSITGIAGPTGGTDEKPVGLVYVGLCDKNDCIVKELHLIGDRDRVRHVTCLHALDMVRRKVLSLSDGGSIFD